MLTNTNHVMHLKITLSTIRTTQGFKCLKQNVLSPDSEEDSEKRKKSQRFFSFRMVQFIPFIRTGVDSSSMLFVVGSQMWICRHGKNIWDSTQKKTQAKDCLQSLSSCKWEQRHQSGDYFLGINSKEAV